MISSPITHHPSPITLVATVPTGLRRSNCFIAVISKSALAKVRDASQDHTNDNVLLEYETAIQIMNSTNNPKFICPIHVGENNYVPALQQVDSDGARVSAERRAAALPDRLFGRHCC